MTRRLWSTRNWQAVASSSNGSNLVAAVYGGQIYTSTDAGVNWTARESSRNWQALASSSDGSKLVAVVYGGQIYTSTDSGVTWTARDSSRNWLTVAVSADGSKAVAAGSSTQIYTSAEAVAVLVLEDSGAYSQTFAAHISVGPANESAQTVSFTVTNDNNALFSSQPAVAADGTLTFTPATNANGSATVTLIAKDNGGTANGGVDASAAQTFLIQVAAVNDAPAFTFATNNVVVLEDAGAVTMASFIANSSVGPANESAQTLSYNISAADTSLFSVQPALAADGTLTFTPATDANGATTITVIVQDNGGTDYGGVDQATKTFTITITAVNDAPTFTLNSGVLSNDGSLNAASSQRVLLIWDDNKAAGTLALKSAIETAGLMVTLSDSVDTNYDGTNPDPTGFNAVIHLHGTTGGADMPLAGQNALVNFVKAGGTYVGSEFITSDFALGRFANLRELILFDRTSTQVGVISYSKLGGATTHPVMDQVPASFILGGTPAYNAGQVHTFATNPATVLMQDSHGNDGVAVRFYGAGRVVNLHNSGNWSGQPVLTDANIQLIYANAARWNGSYGVTVKEDSGTTTVASVVTNLLSGTVVETGQVVSFTVTNDNNALFSSQPVLAVDGTLTFTPAANANGLATVTVIAHDDGGTANRGVDTSTAKTFVITVLAVNDAPSLTFATNNLVVLEDSGAQTVAGFVTASVGPANESAQSLTNYTVSAANTALFSVQPAIALNGTLTFTPAADANGATTITVIAQDNGGTANGGVDKSTNTFTLTITAVNDAPSFALPAATLSIWTPRDANRSWVSVASSADGSKLVAADGNSEVGGLLYTSTDYGTNWTAQSGAGTRPWRAVASSTDGANLVAVAYYQGYIYTSTDSGTNWTEQTGAGGGFWAAVASSADGSKLVAVDYGSEVGGLIYTSTDSGTNWTAQPTAGTRYWQSVASSADGTKLVAAANGGQLYTSLDSGATWSAQETNRNWNAVASSADGSKLVAVVNGGQIYTSTDYGTNWLARDTNRNWSAVSSSTDGAKLVAVVSGGQIYTSTDSGTNWTAWENSRSWQAVASTADGSRVAATVNGGQIYTAAEAVTVTVAEDRGAYSQAGFASKLSVGPANEASQTLSFTVTNDNHALFSSQPAIAANGTLTFTPAASTFGSATVTVIAQDDGGTANGGVDTSAARTFTLVVQPTPQVSSTNTLEDTLSGLFVIAPNATETNVAYFKFSGITGGTLYKSYGQGLALVNNGDFITLAEASVGLQFMPTADLNSGDGSTFKFDVESSADGSSVLALTGKTTRTLTVTAVNDAPSFAFLPWSTWTPQNPSLDWVAVASSSDGSKLIAAQGSGSLYTSADYGTNWTAQTVGNRSWTSVASSSDGTKLVAAGSGSAIYTSTDSGVNWTAGGPKGSFNWTSVASSSDGNNLVAVANAGQIYTSTDSGANWTARDSSRNWSSVASSSDGSKLVAVERGGNIYTSTDSGTSWTARASTTNWQSVASSADGTKLVAVVHGGQIYTSTDSGTNWTARESSRSWTSVASSSDGSKLLAVAFSDQIYVSTDSGVTWSARDSSRFWYAAAMSSDGSRLVAAGNSDYIYTATEATTTFTITVAQDSGAYAQAYVVRSISAGPTNEASQTVSFTVTNDNNALFSVQPAIDASGTLTFTPATGASGNAIVSVQAQDDGGTANGGINTSQVQVFTIQVGGGQQIASLPSISLQANGGEHMLRWRSTTVAFELQTAPAITGPWTPVLAPMSQENGYSSINLPSDGGTRFYRLIRTGTTQPVDRQTQ